MSPSQIENLPCQIVSCSDGLATITFTMPENQIDGFVALLSSLSILFRGLGWKTKTNIEAIHQREKLAQPERESRLLAFEKSVCDTFIDYVSKSSNPREALSLTVSAVGYVYEFSSYEIVKNLLTKNKLLKKTGFYKSKHKFFPAE